MIKVAVASNSGEDISSHFGRCACFAVFEVEEGQITGRDIRPNTFTPHARGQRPGEDHSGGGGGHGPVTEGLGDCQAVISYGMGRRVAQALRDAGIRFFILDREVTAEEAVNLFLRGKLVEGTEGSCGGHHG